MMEVRSQAPLAVKFLILTLSLAPCTSFTYLPRASSPQIGEYGTKGTQQRIPIGSLLYPNLLKNLNYGYNWQALQQVLQQQQYIAQQQQQQQQQYLDRLLQTLYGTSQTGEEEEASQTQTYEDIEDIQEAISRVLDAVYGRVTTTPSINEDDDDVEEETTPSTHVSSTTQSSYNNNDDEDDDDVEEETTPSTAVVSSTAQSSYNNNHDDDDDDVEEETTPSTAVVSSTTQSSYNNNHDDDVEEEDDDEEKTTTPRIVSESSTTQITSVDTSDEEEDDDEVTTLSPVAAVTTQSLYDDDEDVITTTPIVKTFAPSDSNEDENSEENEETTTTTTPTAAPTVFSNTVSNMCDGCELIHGVGYKPHPTDCTLYVQCQADKNGLPVVAGVRPCPHGLYWNQDKLTCDYRHNVNCVDDICRSGAVRKTKPSAASCRGYWDCSSGTALAKCCPNKYSYNSYYGRCFLNNTCTDDCLSSTTPVDPRCPDHMRPVPGDRTKYEVRTGSTWTLMSCPANLGFTTMPCGCNVRLNTTVQQECVPELYLPFISDTQDQSGRQVYVKNEGVQVRDGKAFFNGNSRLTVPRFSNSWWGSTVYVHLRYKSSLTSSRRLALVSNGDCQVRPSLAVCAGPAGVEFYAETENTPQPVNFTVSNFDQDYGWQDVLYRLDAGLLYGQVNFNHDSRAARGNLEVRQRGLVIGSGGGCDDFNGFIDELTIYLCRPHGDEPTTIAPVNTVTTQSPDEETTTTTTTTTPVVTTFTPDSSDENSSEETEETTTTTTTTAAPIVSTSTVPNMCDGCELIHGVGYKPHPTDCTLYVQCQADKNGLPVVAGVRPCPHGLYWNQDKLTCDYRHNVNCVDDICRSGAVRKTKPSAASCRGYWDCSSGTALAKCCPLKYTYNPYIARCTFNPTCTDDCLNSPPFDPRCPDGMRPVPGDPTKYEVKTGSTWTLMSCPANLGFTTMPCGCNVRLNTTVQQECVPELYLPFISDTQDQSGRQVYVKNEGVQVRDGKAFFNGNSRLTVPRFSNSWWGSTVYVHLRYKSSFTSSRRLALVSNGDCQVRPSLAVCAGPAGVEFYAETENTPQPVNFTVSTFDQGYGWQDGWQDVLYRLDAGSLYGHVSLNLDSRPALGNLEVRQRGLVIGGGGGCDDFNGFIDEVTVYLCRPELK